MARLAYRPPTKTALVGAAAQIRDPSSKRKMAAKNPHFAYAGSSESVGPRDGAVSRGAAHGVRKIFDPHRSFCRCARTMVAALG